VHLLERRLDAEGVRSKRWTTRSGRTIGGQPFSRGALFHLLRNKTYIGMIPHKGATHPGMHPAIVDADLFETVQQKLDANARRRTATPERVAKAPLLGRIFDADEQPMSPTFSYGKQGWLYRYYVSAPLQRGQRPGAAITVRRVSAPMIEKVLHQTISRLLPGVASAPLDLPRRIEVRPAAVHLLLPIAHLPDIRERIGSAEKVEPDPAAPALLRLMSPVDMARRGGRAMIIPATDPGPRPDPNLIRALREAHALLGRDAKGRPTLARTPAASHKRLQVRLAFLAPELQRAILEGRQPPGLTLKRLMRGPIPPGWDAQIKLFGRPENGWPGPRALSKAAPCYAHSKPC